MKIAYIRPDIGVPVDDTDLIREVDRAVLPVTAPILCGSILRKLKKEGY